MAFEDLEEETERVDVGHVVADRELLVVPVDDREDVMDFVLIADTEDVREEELVLLDDDDLVGKREDDVVFVERADTLEVLDCREDLLGVTDMRGVIVGTEDRVDVLVEVGVRVSKVATSARSLFCK